LQFDLGLYDAWYDVLNLGIRMTPTAGTDYPCGTWLFPRLPGRDRFYTKVDGPLTYEAWLEGVRLGRTFVSNGPILEFQVNGKGMGEEVVLKKPGTVTVAGRVRFDPKRDAVDRLEVILNGTLLRSFPRQGEAKEISFQFQHEARESSWIAVRASGRKLIEAPDMGRAYLHPSSQAHSAQIYITLEGAPPLSAHPRAKALARMCLARLDDLEARLAEDQIPYLAGTPALGDGVDADHLRENRPALLEAIQSARQYFTNLAR
jgi:hypothetical protein